MALETAIRERIQRLVDDHPVLLFMKGVREAPQCGFSATVVQLLDQLVAEYQTVDVLAEPAIRDGIKQFSDWPTVPQLYVKGEFVGGCDIVKELFETCELHELFGVARGATAAPRVELRPAAAEALRAGLTDAQEGLVLRLLVDARYQSRMVLSPPSEDDFVVESGDVALHVDPLTATRCEGGSVDVSQSRRGMTFQVLLPQAPSS